jgi:hypothetical protein
LQVKGDDDKPIPYSSVFIKKNNKVLVADSAGNICVQGIKEIKTGDTLYLSAIGYKERVLAYSGLMVIKLEKRIIQLPEVVIVNGESQTEEWGTKKDPGIIGGYFCKQGFRQILNSTARIVYPEGEFKRAEIISVSFYDETGKGIDVPVRLRVFLIGNDSLPIGDYLTDNLIVNTKGKGWLDIDLENKELVFPKEGLAFGIELFADSEEYYYTRKVNDGKKDENKIYAFSLAREKGSKDLTMTKVNSWRKWIIERSNYSNCGNLVCRVKVKVWR